MLPPFDLTVKLKDDHIILSTETVQLHIKVENWPSVDAAIKEVLGQHPNLRHRN